MADQTGMQPAEPQAAPVVPVVKQVKQLLSQDKIKEKFGEVLGQKAPQFMACGHIILLVHRPHSTGHC